MEGRDGNRAEAFPYELLDRMGLPGGQAAREGEGPPEGAPRLTHGRHGTARPCAALAG